MCIKSIADVTCVVLEEYQTSLQLYSLFFDTVNGFITFTAVKVCNGMTAVITIKYKYRGRVLI